MQELYENLEYMVFDETDTMLDLGFYRDIKNILNVIATKRNLEKI